MSEAAEALTILLRRGANKTRIEDESRYEAQAREILASDWLAARVASAAADREAVERVRALHVPDPSGDWCDHCWTGPDAHGNGPSPEWPCPTITALSVPTEAGAQP